MQKKRAFARANRVTLDERGFTLIELMITASILSMVLLALFAMIDVSARIAPQDQERGHVIQEAQVGLHRMTRELRQAHRVVSGDADTLVVEVVVGGTTRQVTYDCGTTHPTDSAYRQCTRIVGGSSEVTVDYVVNGSRAVFEYGTTPATDARYVTARVFVSARGGRKQGQGLRHEILYEDGFYMRNRDA